LKDIKTREVIKKIKTIDKPQILAEHMKNTVVKSKETAEQTQEPGYDTPENYATDRTSGASRDTVEQAAHKLKNPGKKASENINRAKQSFQDAKRHMSDAKNAVKKTTTDQPKKETVKQAQNPARRTASRSRQTANESIKTVQRSEKNIKQSAKTIKATGQSTVKTTQKTVKTTQKTVKTAERTAKTAIKTTQQAAKATQKTAQTAAKAAKLAAQASKAAAKATVVAAKTAMKVTIATVKDAIAAIKGLIALIAAGGWIAVVIILIICMIGLLMGSIFGIFFSGEDSGSGYTMPMAIAEINTEYSNKITEIRNNNTHDDVVMSGSRAGWKEVLAVYAVKINTDPAKAQDVATMDESRKELLRSVFWDMNAVTYHTEKKTYTETTVTDDGNGNLIETEQTVIKTILYITVSSKTATEMVEQYGFTTEQKAQLSELLSDEYADLWNAVMYGIHAGSEDIVAVAVSQIGNVGGEPYWSWYGFGSSAEWCACFVSWCANECGYIDAFIIPKFAACTSQGMPWFKERGLWQESGYVPEPGDIIFFDWDDSGNADHVGIVERVEGEVVQTIEGNTSDSCARRSYRLDSNVIRGYGTPLYE